MDRKHDLDNVVACAMLAVIAAASTHVVEKEKKVRKKRRWSVRPIFREREEKGHFHHLFQIMKVSDNEQFFRYTRMSQQNFNKLLNLVRHKLVKQSNRPSLSPEQRLVLTLYYLAHGCSMQVVSWSFLVGKTTVSVVVKETCKAIWDVLKGIYLQQPNNNKWLEIANEFEKKWNLPNCCGAIDGKHIIIQAPKKSGTEYFNYKKSFSIVLMAVCDASYRFTMVDIGAFGSQSDGGVFRESTFGKAIESRQLQLPPSKTLPESDILFPHFWVGDEAFPLKPYILRPYPGRNLNIEKKIFNYRLSRARRTIENAFGILASRWRIFRHNIIVDVPTAELIVAASICLHNFLRTSELESANDPRMYCPPNYVDTVSRDGSITPGSWREGFQSDFHRIGRVGSNCPSRDMISLRNSMSKYLVEEGSVPWQLEYVNRGSHPSK